MIYDAMDYEFKLTGAMPILFHADDVMAADELKQWRSDPKNKNVSVAGDDRSPPWTWQTYVYNDGEHVAIPQENLMTAIRKAAAGIKIPNKGQKTFKELSQSGMLMASDYLTFTSNGKQIPIAAFSALKNEPFAVQKQRVCKMGFDLLVKRAAVDKKKHVRVRLKVEQWEVSGITTVNDPIITESVLRDFFEYAGRYSGLLDWRPNSPKSPGPYGTFTAEVKAIKGGRRAG